MLLFLPALNADATLQLHLGLTSIPLMLLGMVQSTLRTTGLLYIQRHLQFLLFLELISALWHLIGCTVHTWVFIKSYLEVFCFLLTHVVDGIRMFPGTPADNMLQVWDRLKQLYIELWGLGSKKSAYLRLCLLLRIFRSWRAKQLKLPHWLSHSWLYGWRRWILVSVFIAWFAFALRQSMRWKMCWVGTGPLLGSGVRLLLASALSATISLLSSLPLGLTIMFVACFCSIILLSCIIFYILATSASKSTLELAGAMLGRIWCCGSRFWHNLATAGSRCTAWVTKSFLSILLDYPIKLRVVSGDDTYVHVDRMLHAVLFLFRVLFGGWHWR